MALLASGTQRLGPVERDQSRLGPRKPWRREGHCRQRLDHLRVELGTVDDDLAHHRAIPAEAGDALVERPPACRIAHQAGFARRIRVARRRRRWQTGSR
ncbi:MAG: hypothetical protein AAFZ09_01380, partial [Pseudomonadota bacterium]